MNDTCGIECRVGFVAPRWGLMMVLIWTQGGARSSLALGWLVDGPLALKRLGPFRRSAMLKIGTSGKSSEFFGLGSDLSNLIGHGPNLVSDGKG